MLRIAIRGFVVMVACLTVLGCGGGSSGGNNVRIETLEEDLAALRERLSIAETERDTAQAGLATANEQLSTARTNLETATTRATEAEANLATAAQALTAARTELATTTARATEAEADLETANEQLATARTNLSTARTRTTEAEASLTMANNQLATARTDLAAANKRLADTQADLTAAEIRAATAEAVQGVTGDRLETIQEQLAAAETARDAALAAQRAAERQRNTAETAARQANNAKIAAETTAAEAIKERDAAVTAQKAAETARDAALTAQRTAEVARRAAEDELAALRAQQAGDGDDDDSDQDAADRALSGLLNGDDDDTGTQQPTQQQPTQQVSEAEQRVLAIRAAGTGQTGSLGYIAALLAASDLRRTTASVTWARGGNRMINPGGNFSTGSGAPGISGFTAFPYTRAIGLQSRETAFVYTNIGSPSTRPYWKVHGLRTPDTTNDVRLSGTGSYNATTMMTTVGGSLDSVSGTFTCADILTNCVISRNAGNLEFDNDSLWRFFSTRAVNQPQDDGFLYFGIWESVPDDPAGTHGFQVIHGGGGVNNADPIAAVTGALAIPDALAGTAKFKGGAIGKYVTRNQVGQGTRIGTFTAQADFTIDFGTAATGSTLEGRITNFRDGNRTLENWDIYLGGTATTAASLTAGVANVASGGVIANIGGVSANTGGWSANVYGSLTGNLTDRRTIYPVTSYPLADIAGVAGQFQASDGAAATANIAIAGAFAAQ